MRPFLKCIALTCIGASLTVVAYAAPGPQPVTTLTCQRQDATKLTLPVYAFLMDSAPGASRFFMVYTDASHLNQLLYEEYFAPGPQYSSCSLAALGQTGTDNNTIQDVTPLAVGTHTGTDVSANGGETWKKNHIYVSVVLEYTLLSIGPLSSSSALTRNTTPLSPEDHAKALEAFKARGAATLMH